MKFWHVDFPPKRMALRPAVDKRSRGSPEQLKDCSGQLFNARRQRDRALTNTTVIVSLALVPDLFASQCRSDRAPESPCFDVVVNIFVSYRTAGPRYGSFKSSRSPIPTESTNYRPGPKRLVAESGNFGGSSSVCSGADRSRSSPFPDPYSFLFWQSRDLQRLLVLLMRGNYLPAIDRLSNSNSTNDAPLS